MLTNEEESHAMIAITNSIKDRYLGITGTDRVAENLAQLNRARAEDQQAADSLAAFFKKQQANKPTNVSLDNYKGDYRDNWFGKVTISLRNGQLWFASSRSPQLRGVLSYYQGDCFIARWQNRRLNADVFVLFRLDEHGKAVGFTMKAVSANTDFSYDFQDLDFKQEAAKN